MVPPYVLVESLRYAAAARPILEGVDLAVDPGEVLGLIGPNGGGKSTLILLLAGLLRPGGGRVSLGGRPANEVAVATTGEIGLITAEPGLYPLLTGAENLRFFAGLLGISSAEADRRAEPWARSLDLTDALATPVGAWSSGMKQKLSLVRARLGQPRVLLLDEPTANLDPVSASAVWRAVAQAADEGIAVVIATHDLTSAEARCDKVAVLQRTVRHVHHNAQRREPPPSPLLALYREHVDEVGR